METSLSSGQSNSLTGTRKELSWAQARHKGLLAKGGFSPLKSLQNPIGKAGLHHGEGNILISNELQHPKLHKAQALGLGTSLTFHSASVREM